MPNPNGKARILVVDDDDGILQVSRVSLKRVKFRDQRLQILLASSSKQAVEMLSNENGVGVMLIDGEMETKTAGLDTCEAVRKQLGNQDLRIFLRTGKVDMDAQEVAAKEDLDLEGHIPKGDTSKEQLVAAVLKGLEAYYARVDA